MVNQKHICRVPSRFRARFSDSAGDINFHQLFLSQSESINQLSSIKVQYDKKRGEAIRLTCSSIGKYV